MIALTRTVWNAYREFAVRGTDWLASVPPLAMALAASLYSLLTLLLLAPLTGVWVLTNRHGQQVGYASTLNWAIGFTLLAPLFYFFLLRAVREVGRLPARLDRSQMLLDGAYEPHSRAAQLMASRWTVTRKRYATWWLTLALLGLAESIGEWAATSLLPLMGRGDPAELEFDWSVAHLGGEPLRRALNAVFSLVVFLQQAWILCMIAYLIFFVLSFAALVNDLRREGRAIRLFPSLRPGDDPRLGFQQFADVFSSFLFAALFLYAHFFLSRLWNAFLHPEEGEHHAESVWQLVREPLFEGARAVGDGGVPIKELLLEFLEGVGALNFSGLAVSFGALILLILSSTLLVFVMRKNAVNARDELLELEPKAVEKKRLEGMAVWPLKYPGLNTLAALGLLGAVSMLAYRLGVYFVGLVLVVGCSWSVKQLREKPPHI